ncbi:MAG TPA: cytochrome b5 domain-containing protein [Candidatus Pacearchaeota archaeon]|nr:cytochrome b5 domain-containing protein [Candidatus Pacearchaeota archaeon]
MKKLLPIILSVFFFFLFISKSFAYTLSDVGQHDTSSDCWVMFNNSVYDLTEYLPRHDRFLDIRKWCGKDMTEDFKNKAGVGRDHRASSYSLLEQYRIGDLELENVGNEKSTTKSREYNMIIPLLISVLAYWIPYYIISKKENKGNKLFKFNAFWNTILVLTLLIPSFGFGIFMMIRIKNPELYNIKFDFMYWHVELSVVMGIIAINHFLQRLSVFKKQLITKF